ncbi:unnamed protein product, partial [Adineta ricciae]
NSLIIANHTREQDLLIANTLRWDTIFAAYIDNVSSIARASNFSFDTIDPLLTSIIRAKTMTVCRQLDVTRKTYLIRFLFEPKAILSHRHVIDLSVSAFSTKQTASLEDISLTGVSLTNASFAVRQFVGANFTESNLQGANFQYASLRNVSFRMAILRNTNFNDTTMSNIDFSGSDLIGSTITMNNCRKHIRHLALFCLIKLWD